MSSVAKTPHLELSQHLGTENFERADYVSDMLKIDLRTKQISDEVAIKPNRYSNSSVFPIGDTLTVNHAACLATTLIRIFPQETTLNDKKGVWSVNSDNGKFIITSDTQELVGIPFIWEFFEGGE